MSSLVQVLDEGSENGKKISAVFDDIGESMYDANGQIKSGFGLLQALSSHWGELKKNKQLEIAELIAGKNQINNFMALMNNFGHAVEATNTAMESQGSALQENERYMGGLEAKTTAVKAAFQQLSKTIVNSDMVKGGLDLAINLMDKLNTKAGATAVQLTLLGGVFTGLAGMAKAGGILDVISKVGASLLAIPKPLLVIGGLVAAAAKAYDYFHVSSKEALGEAKELQQELEESYGQGSRLDELISKQQQLNELEKAELDYLQNQQKILQENIKLKNQEAFEKWQEESGSKAQGGRYMGPSGEYVDTTKDVTDLITTLEQVTYLQKDISEGWVDLNTLPGRINDIANSTTELTEQLMNWKNMGFELSDAQERFLDLGMQWTDILANNEDAVVAYGLMYEQAMKTAGYSEEEAIESAGKAIDELMTSLQNSTQDLSSEKPEIDINTNAREATNDINAVGTAVNSLPDSHTIKIDVVPSGGIPGFGLSPLISFPHAAEGTDNAKGGPTLVNELGPELISANGKAWIAGGGRPVVTNLPKGAIVLTADETKSALKSNSYSGKMPAHAKGWKPGMGQQMLEQAHRPSHSYQAKPSGSGGVASDRLGIPNITPQQAQAMGAYTYLELLKQQASKKPPTGAGSGGSSTPSGPPPVDIKEQSKAFKEQLDILKDRLDIMEKEGKSEEERIDHIKKIQAEIEKQKQWYYDHGEDENSKYIRDLEKQWWKYADEMKDLYKDQAGYYEMLFGAVGDKAQEEIDVLENQKNEIRKQNDELQKQVELEKALDELARAKQQKKLVLRNGEMVYATDVDAVSEAQARVDEIKNRESADKRIEAIDKQIEEWEKYKEAWTSVVDNYEKKQDLLLLAEKFGVKLEEKNWQEKLGNLQDYIIKYNDLMVKAGYKNVDLSAGGLGSAPAGGLPSMGGSSTSNLGVPSPASLLSNVGSLGEIGKSIGITIQNFNPNLPGVSDGEGFVKYLRNNFLQQTLQFANG